MGFLSNDVDNDNKHLGVVSFDDTGITGNLTVDLAHGILGGLRGEYLDLNDNTFPGGNSSSNNIRLYDPLDEYIGPGVSDFVLQRHPLTPTGDAANVITPRIDFGAGTDVTQGDGTVLDRSGFNSSTVPNVARSI